MRIRNRGHFDPYISYFPGDCFEKQGKWFIVDRGGSARPAAAVPDPVLDRVPLDGKDGERGADGRDGIAGPPGSPGTGFRFRGPWKRSLAFEVNDICTHEGQTWLAMKAVTKSEPGVGKAFVLLAARGEDGIDGKTFHEASRVIHRTEVLYGTSAPLLVLFDSPTSRGAVVFASGDGRVDLALANAEPQALAIGLSLEGVAENSPGQVITSGVFVNDSWSLEPGAVYYLDGTVPGGMTSIYPTTVGHYVVILGAAMSTTTINLKIHWANYIAE